MPDDRRLSLTKAVRRVLERKLVGGVRVHPGGKGLDRDLSPEVNHIANEVGGINFGGINLDDCNILSKTILPCTMDKRGRKNNMTNDTTLQVLPVSLDISKEQLELFDSFFCLVLQLGSWGSSEHV